MVMASGFLKARNGGGHLSLPCESMPDDIVWEWGLFVDKIDTTAVSLRALCCMY